jgi:hypothetical protein
MEFMHFNQKQHEFKCRREQVRQEYDMEVRNLQRELSAKIDLLKVSRDRKLNAIALEAAKFEDDYRLWKAQQINEQRKEQNENTI